MDDIFFNGFWRMDWGLGNPNKTAALIATLMVVVWFLAYMRRWGFWVALVLFSGFGICLVHTFSRGGLVAVVLGLVPVMVMVMLRRPWSRSRMLGVLAAIWVIVGASVFLQAHERYGQGVVQEDHSISNRLEIWKTTPQMMVDAPGGWGVGNSGLAYINWYQPLDQHEGYRTLVNSHLTWLVEFGWPGRILYLAGWVTVFSLCFPTKRTPWLAVPFGIWVAFFVGALFSSVAESVWLWVVPSLALGIVLVWRIARRQWPTRSTLLLPPAVAAAACALLMAVIPGSAIRKEGGIVKIGGPSPVVWVVADTTVLGKQPGRSLRTAVRDLNGLSVGLTESLDGLPLGALSTLILAGGIPVNSRELTLDRLKSAESLILVNPRFFPQEFDVSSHNQMQILLGEFSQSPAASTWEGLAAARRLPGIGDFIPDWPVHLLPKP